MEGDGAHTICAIVHEARVIAALRGGLGWKLANEAAYWDDTVPSAKDLLLAERMMGPIAFGEKFVPYKK